MAERIKNHREFKEDESDLISIHDVESYYHCSIDQAGINLVEKYLDEIKNDDKQEQRYRRSYRIPEDRNFKEALEEKVARAVDNYESKIAFVKSQFKGQAEHCLKIVQEKGYQKNNKPLKIIVTDEFLHEGIPGTKGKQSTNAYDYEDDLTVVTIDSPNKLLAHEVGHALSTNQGEKRDGFLTLESKPNGDMTSSGNKWFNEGLTVIWEDLSVNDKSEIKGRDESDDFYKWYKDAVKLILKHININTDDALKAYFGNENKIQQIHTKIREKFNCSLNDLDCLDDRRDANWTERVISGKNVEVTIRESTHKTEVDKLQKLSRLFPNVKLVFEKGK